jgi:hypothetical protein
MTRRVPCPPAPGPLEGYAARFDDLFGSLAQRRGFREYLTGLLAPRDRNKTLTALAGAEPVAGAQHPAVQRLQFFLSESRWDPAKVNERRLELLLADPATAPHGGGVLVLDDSGDRKDGVKTAHVGHQWLGRYGSGPGRDHADLRRQALDRAGLQAGQGRAGLGRLPGPLRCRDPPPPGPGELRVQLLLGRLVHGKPVRARRRATATGTRRRREGAPTPPRQRRHRPGRGHCARYAPGFPPGSRCSAGGRHGPRRPRPRSCKP